jgi:hypothetical protein
VIGDGYELINKEVPGVPDAPTVEVKGPLAPEVSRCEIVRVVAPGAEKAQPLPQTQANAPEKVCPPPTVVYQQGPQSQLDRLIAANKNLSKGDRDRLADTLFDFSKTLDTAGALGIRATVEGNEISKEWREGSIAKKLEAHKAKLHDIDSSAKDFYQMLVQTNDRGKYFQDQTSYVFGDNPYNLGPGAIENAAQMYIIYMERWATIQNKDQQSVVLIFENQQNEYDRYMAGFHSWVEGCRARLDQMRKSIQ